MEPVKVSVWAGRLLMEKREIFGALAAASVKATHSQAVAKAVTGTQQHPATDHLARQRPAPSFPNHKGLLFLCRQLEVSSLLVKPSLPSTNS